jgi:dihydroorotase
MASELLQQVRLLDPVSGTDRVADVLIEAGIIAAIAEQISDYPADTQVWPAQGHVLAPGLVDLYSHSGEPGFEERETLDSLTQAAIAGGFTRLTLLPDTNPALDHPASIAWLQDKVALMASPLHLQCWAALTLGTAGQQMTEVSELAASSIVGFSDGKPIQNPLLVQRLLEYLQPTAKPIALWANDPQLAGNGVIREGEDALRFGLPGIPAIAEAAALSQLLECVAAIRTPVHLMRISTARGVELIQAAKNRGLPITASTTWMHLLLNSADLGSYNASLRLDPPLGTPSDQMALIQGVQSGVLDAIAVDHAPYTYEEKTVAFAEAPPGAIGLELALPLLWQHFVAPGTWSALELWRSLSSGPAACLQQAPATIAVQQPAELTLFAPHARWTVEERSLRSIAQNTPWLGKSLQGRVVKTWCPRPGSA